MITKEEKIISNTLFENLLIESLSGSFLKLSIGTLLKKSIFTLRRGNPLKSGTTLNLIKCLSAKSTKS